MRILIIISLIFLFTGCFRTKYVYIPQKCEIEPPQKPTRTLNTPQDVLNILKYSEILEKDLNFCIYGK